MIEKYFDKLKGEIPDDLFKNGQGFIYLSDDFSNEVEKDIIFFEYKSLYASIIIKLCENSIITINKEDFEKLRDFLDGKIKESSPDYKALKEFTYSAYAFYLTKDQQKYVLYYITLFYKDFIEKFKDSIAYIDVDLIFFKKEKEKDIINYLSKLNVKFETKIINYLFLSYQKRYVYVNDNNDFYYKGFSKSNKSIETKEVIKNRILSEIREDKINSILR